MADIQVLVDKSPLPAGFSPVCDPLDSSEARVRGGGWGAAFASLRGRPWRGLRDHRRSFSEPRLPAPCIG